MAEYRMAIARIKGVEMDWAGDMEGKIVGFSFFVPSILAYIIRKEKGGQT